MNFSDQNFLCSPLTMTNEKVEVYELLVLPKQEGLIEFGVDFGILLPLGIKPRSILFQSLRSLR